MADTKISATAAAGALDGTEVVPVLQGGVNKKTTSQAIADLPPSVPILAPNGTGGAPSYSFVNQPAMGFYNAGGGGDVYFTKNISYHIKFGDPVDGIRIGNTGPLAFSSTSNADAAPNASLCWESSGILAVTNGPTLANGGDLRDIHVRNVIAASGEISADNIVVGGYLRAGSNGSSARVLGYNDLELCVGNGGSGTKVQVNNGTLDTLRDLEARYVYADRIARPSDGLYYLDLGSVGGQASLVIGGTEVMRWDNTGTTTAFFDLKARSLISTGGVVRHSQYTNATEPSWVNGDEFFNTDLDKLRIGGAAAWETVTSV